MVTVAVSPSRTRLSPSRASRSALTGTASSRSAAMPASSTPSMTSTVTVDLTASTTRTQASATAAARPLSATASSPRDLDGGQHSIEHALWRDALKLRLWPELKTVPQRGPGDGLHVVGDHVTAPGEPRPGAAGG